MNRPNIVYIHSHDTGRCVQPYGHAIATPHLQRLAEQGVLLRQAFCAAPTCSPSRAALLTGQWPHQAGMFGLAHRGFSLSDYSHHFVHTLRQAGYLSALIGVQHVAHPVEGRHPADIIGYDWHDTFDRNREAPEVAAAAEQFLAAAPRNPFFLSVGFFETHRPFPAPPDDGRFRQPLLPLPDVPPTRLDAAAFAESARRLDEGIGRVLAALDRAGLADNTLVICTTDHGPAFPLAKCNLTDAGIGVMLLMRGPAPFAGGRTVDSLVSHVDVFPTLCEVAGLEPPAWLVGHSLLPILRGERTEIRDSVFAEVTFHAAEEPMRGVRTRRHKYIRRYDDRTTPVLPNCDDGPSKEAFLAAGWLDQPRPREMLFDLFFDPCERHNLVGEPQAQAVLAEMRERLDAWQRRTDDPILRGRIAPPSGAMLNDPDGQSHREPPTRVP